MPIRRRRRVAQTARGPAADRTGRRRRRRSARRAPLKITERQNVLSTRRALVRRLTAGAVLATALCAGAGAAHAAAPLPTDDAGVSVHVEITEDAASPTPTATPTTPSPTTPAPSPTGPGSPTPSPTGPDGGVAPTGEESTSPADGDLPSTGVETAWLPLGGALLAAGAVLAALARRRAVRADA
jgi:LPXTG-motif cell wall-anchored protein